MPDFILELQRKRRIAKWSPWPAKGLLFALYHSPTRKKYTYKELASRQLPDVKVSINTNTACYASFQNMFNAFRQTHGRLPNYVTSKWNFRGTNTNPINDVDAPGPEIWAHASHRGRSSTSSDYLPLRYTHFKTFIDESKKLGFLKPMDTAYWMNRFEMTTHILNHSPATLYFIWSHERYMVEYPNVVAYFYELLKQYPAMDPYIRMTIALYAGGANTSHGYFPVSDCYINGDNGGWSFKRTADPVGIVVTAYRLRECCRKGVGKTKSLKESRKAGSFNCSNKVSSTKIDQYNRDLIPRKVEDLLTFKLEEYKDAS